MPIPKSRLKRLSLAIIFAAALPGCGTLDQQQLQLQREKDFEIYREKEKQTIVPGSILGLIPGFRG